MQLDEKIEKLIVTITQNYEEVEKVILFGTRARAAAIEYSDIVIAIVGKNIAGDDWLDLYFELQEEFNTLLSIEVIWFNKVSKELKENIKKEGRVLYDNT